jgi:hypothetical protein
MDNKIVSIHQPNFMPWLGYFYKIFQSDIFILLDDAQFQKKGASYTNRVSINMNGEEKYLTLPVKRKKGNWNINDATFDGRIKKKIISSLQCNYAKAKYFKENKEFIFDLINFESINLATYNINFILKVCEKLNITTNLVKSSNYEISTTSTQRLVDLIKKVDGMIYISGSGGDKYQDKESYINSNIELTYNKMPLFKYTQLKTDDFIPGLSIIDAILNIGFERLKEGLFYNY